MKVFVAAVFLLWIFGNNSLAPKPVCDEKELIGELKLSLLNNFSGLDSSLCVVEIAVLRSGRVLTSQILHPKSLRCEGNYISFVISTTSLTLCDSLNTAYNRNNEDAYLVKVPLHLH